MMLAVRPRLGRRDGRRVAEGEELRSSKSFKDHHALQSATARRDADERDRAAPENPHPSEDEIKKGCRATSAGAPLLEHLRRGQAASE